MSNSVAVRGSSSSTAIWTPDTPPLAPDARNEEFNGIGLGVWATRVAVPAIWDINVTCPSMAYARLGTNENLDLVKAITFDTNMSITYCFYCAGWSNYATTVIGLISANEQDEIQFGIQNSATPLTVVNLFVSALNANVWTYNTGLSTLSPKGKYYLHIIKTGNVYAFYFSFDGIAFMPLGATNGGAGYSLTKAFTPTKIHISQTGSATVGQFNRSAFDFLRFNWINV